MLGKKKLSPHTMTTIVLGTRMASCHYISRYLLYPVLEPMVKLPFSACAREGFCTFDFLVDTDWTLDAKTFTASMICTGASVEELRVNASEQCIISLLYEYLSIQNHWIGKEPGNKM